MNVFTEIGKQITDLFNSMTPQARVMAGLMAGVIVVSLGWILTSQGSSETVNLFGQTFTDSELVQMESAFSQAGLGNFERRGLQMRIPKSEKEKYIQALNDSNAIPKRYNSFMNDAMAGAGVFEPATTQKMRFKTADEQKLAALLMGISGIEFAAVHYDEKKTAFMRDAQRSCSVWVQAPMGRTIESNLIRSIASHTASCFAGLKPGDVSVIDQGTGTRFQASSDPNGLDESPYLTEQIRIEEKIQAQIANLLGNNYGDYTLLVNAELDTTLTQQEEQLTYDATPVALQSSSMIKNSTNQKTPASGRPGAASNDSTANSSAALSGGSPAQSSTNKETQEDQKKVAGHTVSTKRIAGLTPKKISITLGIPESHYKKVWEHQQLQLAGPDANPEDAAQWTALERQKTKGDIEDSLTAALQGITVNVRGGEDTKPYITVMTIPDLPVDPLPLPGLAENAMAWLAGAWSTLALLAVLMVSLGMMFSWVKSQGELKSDAEFAGGFGLQIPDNLYDSMEIDGEGAAAGADGDKKKVEFEVTGGETKEDLSTLIKENPDVAVNLLKSWIGDAA